MKIIPLKAYPTWHYEQSNEEVQERQFDMHVKHDEDETKYDGMQDVHTWLLLHVKQGKSHPMQLVFPEFKE